MSSINYWKKGVDTSNIPPFQCNMKIMPHLTILSHGKCTDEVNKLHNSHLLKINLYNKCTVWESNYTIINYYIN